MWKRPFSRCVWVADWNGSFSVNAPSSHCAPSAPMHVQKDLLIRRLCHSKPQRLRVYVLSFGWICQALKTLKIVCINYSLCAFRASCSDTWQNAIRFRIDTSSVVESLRVIPPWCPLGKLQFVKWESDYFYICISLQFAINEFCTKIRVGWYLLSNILAARKHRTKRRSKRKLHWIDAGTNW